MARKINKKEINFRYNLITIFTYIGVFATVYWFVYKFLPWIDGIDNRG